MITHSFQVFQSIFSAGASQINRLFLLIFRDESDRPFKYVVYREKALHRLCYRLMNANFSIIGWLGGLQNGKSLYKLLLKQTTGKRMLGFDNGSTSHTILVLDPPDKDGMRPMEIIWTKHPKLVGWFKLREVCPNNTSNEMEVHCVWDSGPRTGQLFTVSSEHKYLVYEELRNENAVLPAYVYSPWKLLLFVEVALTTLLAFLVSHLGEILLELIKYLGGLLS